MRALQFADVLSGLKGQRAQYKEVVRVPDLSVGVYRIPAGADDPQRPHTEDEVYHVVSGQARFVCDGADIEARPGTVIYVEAGADHRFHSVEEDLTVLVFFGPAEGARSA